MINVMPGGVARSSQTKQARKSPEPKGNQEQTAAGSKKKKQKQKKRTKMATSASLSLYTQQTTGYLQRITFVSISKNSAQQ
jgi:hypothetical protein